MSVMLSRMITLTAGTLYPAYKSYKAVRTKDVREYVKWMMYWIVFAIYCFVETLADILIAFWFPFYYQLKIVFVFWLLSPWTKGASILYRKWIHPTLAKHEKGIDAMLDQAKSESYNQVVRLGSRTLLCARDIVAEAAVRGQQQLVNQLQRSYSANDVNQQGGGGRMTVSMGGMAEIEEIDGASDHEHEIARHDDDPAMDLMDDGEQHQPVRPRHRRSRSRSRTLEGGENEYATMPRRNPRRH